LSVAIFSALPLLSVAHLTYTDALFETISGITTTGSTVLVDLDSEPLSVLLWRSLLQWIGGLGFVVMGVALLPFVGVGGMRLFHSESSDWSEKAMPRTRSLAGALVLIYGGLTLGCLLAYMLAGMSLFDAANHAMTTVSTGGYSVYDDSLAHYESSPILLIASLFMVAGSLPFALYIQVVRGRFKRFFQDEQVRGFLSFLAVTILLLTSWLAYSSDENILNSFTAASFNVVSIVTTTGYVSTDYMLWGSFGFVVFLCLMFVGGCSGSTTGAIKIFRFQLAYRLFKANMQHLLHPHGIFPLKYNETIVDFDIVRSLVAFSLAFFSIIGLSTLLLALTGLDPITSLSGSITAISNVGPGLGPVIGPAGNFSALPDSAKWILSIDMILGRLEIMTVVTVFSLRFWRL
jgi:trk system potassium uptake protein TrkH